MKNINAPSDIVFPTSWRVTMLIVVKYLNLWHGFPSPFSLSEAFETSELPDMFLSILAFPIRQILMVLAQVSIMY